MVLGRLISKAQPPENSMPEEQKYPKQLQKYGETLEVKDPIEEGRARSNGYTEPYKFQEYPRSLYMGGVRETHPVTGEQVSADHVVVNDAKEEESARAKGYLSLGETAPEKKSDAKADAKAEKKSDAK
jgi:hypothetical protein